MFKENDKVKFSPEVISRLEDKKISKKMRGVVISSDNYVTKIDTGGTWVSEDTNSSIRLLSTKNLVLV